MYSPGNSLIVNLCMRFPAIAVIAGVCGAGYVIEQKLETPPPAPVVIAAPVVAPPVVVAPAPVVVEAPPAPKPLPVLRKKIKKHG
jgi:hypothetical protein